MRSSIYIVIAFIFISCGTNEPNTDKSDEEIQAEASKVASSNNATHVYFGDTHLHTELSMDAGAFGNRLGIDASYRFAKGEVVKSSTGQQAKLSRPLDFLVVSDHSDGMGFFQAVKNGDEELMKYEQTKRWNQMINSGEGPAAALELIGAFSQNKLEMDANNPELQKSVWKMTQDEAEKHNEPGKFTAFIGYEWTSLVKGNNLHRCVVFRDGKDKTQQQIPYTMGQSPDPEDLWAYLAEYEKMTGGKVLAIPHNGNLSNGLMFTETRLNGDPMNEAYVKQRIRWEPLMEATQIKGDGEAHPFLSPNDEFASFETWDFGNLDASEAKTNEMLQYEYARSALQVGLRLKKKLGTNPYEFGMIGSTDSHTSLSTADDNNFYGKMVTGEPGNKDRYKHTFFNTDVATIYNWNTIASGYAAIWATENTREALWDAMMRRETYATTGPRMKVRFFGGFDFSEEDMTKDYVAAGYDRGVPMGGVLAKNEKAPTFMVHAIMDPEGGSLDRMQIVKVWIDSEGARAEKIYDLAWAGDRVKGDDGKVPAIDNTVSMTDATWDNNSGSIELKKFWSDPEFDPNMDAVYYVRVLEIPTPKWTLLDKVQYNITDMSEDVPLVAQQRAYTSPIWYYAD